MKSIGLILYTLTQPQDHALRAFPWRFIWWSYHCHSELVILFNGIARNALACCAMFGSWVWEDNSVCWIPHFVWNSNYSFLGAVVSICHFYFALIVFCFVYALIVICVHRTHCTSLPFTVVYRHHLFGIHYPAFFYLYFFFSSTFFILFLYIYVFSLFSIFLLSLLPIGMSFLLFFSFAYLLGFFSSFSFIIFSYYFSSSNNFIFFLFLLHYTFLSFLSWTEQSILLFFSFLTYLVCIFYSFFFSSLIFYHLLLFLFLRHAFVFISWSFNTYP